MIINTFESVLLAISFYAVLLSAIALLLVEVGVIVGSFSAITIAIIAHCDCDDLLATAERWFNPLVVAFAASLLGFFTNIILFQGGLIK